MEQVEETHAATAVSAAGSRPQSPGWRARRRDSEYRSREKRKAVHEAMVAQVEVLESVLEALPLALLDEKFISEDEQLADEEESSRAVREVMRKSVALSEATQLKTANAQIRRTIRQHEVATGALRAIVRSEFVDKWEVKKRRWSAITHATFTPWAVDAAHAFLDEAMREIRQFSFAGGDFETSGLTFCNWRDRRKLNDRTGGMNFSFTRTYDNHDAESLAQAWWKFVQSSSQFAQAMLGPNVKCYYEILQHVTPDIFIVRVAEEYPDSPFQIHQLIMGARLRTRDGFIQIHRAIPCPEMMAAMKEKTAIWTANFRWIRHDVKKRNENGECTQVKASANGTFVATSTEYANRWMVELAISLVRIDTTILGQKLLL